MYSGSRTTQCVKLSAFLIASHENLHINSQYLDKNGQ